MHFNGNAGLQTDVRKKADRAIFVDSFHTRDQRSSYGPGQLTRLWYSEGIVTLSSHGGDPVG